MTVNCQHENTIELTVYDVNDNEIKWIQCAECNKRFDE